MTKSLLAFDTDKIKSYVFATDKLKEIRAASAILDELNRQTMPELVGGEMIYANGGGGLFVVDSDQVDKIKMAVEQAYREKFASITGVSVNCDDKVGFQTKFRQLRHLMRLVKDQAKGEQLLLTHPYLHFCESCGTEYAQESSTGNELICASCQTKRKRDDSFKDKTENPNEDSLNHILWRIEHGDTLEIKEGLWHYLISQLAQKNYLINGFDRPKDFDELAKLSSPTGYMGLIYADGDGMGKKLDKIKSPEQMHDFAESVDTSMYEATVEAINQHLKPDENSKIWPFDILMLGGDDLIMVTRAESAIAVGKTVMEKFTELTKARYTQEYGGEPLCVSVSVVIAHAHYPFGALQNLAETGLKFAKKEGVKRRQEGQSWDGGLLNFFVVSSANHLDFGEYYGETLTDYVTTTDKTKEKNLYRTLRPYNGTDLTLLLETIGKLRKAKAPSSKLEQLRSAIFQPKMQAMIDCLILLFHLRSDKQRQAIWEAVINFMTNANKPAKPTQFSLLFPWFQQGNKFFTPLLDLVELYEFVDKETPND